MKIFKKIFLIFISILNFSNTFCGLLPETMVLVGSGAYLKAKNLAVEDFLPIYDIPTHSFDEENQKIVEIKTRNTKTVIKINFENENNIDEIIVGENQKLYNRRITKFIPAKEFQGGDILFSPEKGNLIVTNVSLQKLDNPIKLYDIALEDSGIFLIVTKNKTHILAHNFAFIPMILTWALGGKILETVTEGAIAITTAILCVKHHDKQKKDTLLKKNQDEQADSNTELKYEDKNKAPNNNNNNNNGGKNNPNLDEILKDTTTVEKEKGRANVYEKDGGIEQLEKDFEKLNKGEIEYKTNKKGETLKKGKTCNGEDLICRYFSHQKSKNRPTLEIHHQQYNYTKVRYN